MTSSEWHDSDEALLSELRAAVTGAGSVPRSMVEAARAAFAWRDVDAELELLVLAYDSLVEGGALVRDAGGPGPVARTLVFDGDGVSLEVEVGDEIEGQLIPPQPGCVELLGAGGTLGQVQADPMGCFRLPRPGHGPLRFRCTTSVSGGTTDWWSL